MIPGDYTYSVRYTAVDGSKTDIPCSPDPVTVAGNVNTTPECSATVVGGNVELSWNDLPGVDKYQLRRDGSWLGSVGDVSMATDVNAPAGSHTYEVRHRSGGVSVDTPCGTVDVGGAGPACIATANGAEVTIVWDAVPGENSFVVRRDGGWVATTNNVTSYTDTPTAGTHDYVVRYFDGGAVDLDCGTVTVTNNAGPSCTATVVGDDVVITWSSVAGEDRYIVRRDGKWIATVDNAVTYTDPTPAAGAHDYVVRWVQGGVRTDLSCGSVNV